MGGGNAQKSAMARERNAAAAAAQGRGGGGNEGKEKRGGDTAAKIAAGQAEKAEREAKKVALAEKKKLEEEKEAKKLAKAKKEAEKVRATLRCSLSRSSMLCGQRLSLTHSLNLVYARARCCCLGALIVARTAATVRPISAARAVAARTISASCAERERERERERSPKHVSVTTKREPLLGSRTVCYTVSCTHHTSS